MAQHYRREHRVGGFTDAGRVVARRVFTPVAALLLKLKVSPDAVTVVGTVGTSAAALYFFPRGELLLGTLVWAIRAIWPHKRWVALANLPYLAWVAFATVLQLSITWLNR